MRLLGESLAFTAFGVICRQGAGLRFGIIADSVPKTQNRLGGVFAVAWSKEQTVGQVDSDRTGVGNGAAWIWVTVDEDFVLARRRRCNGEGEGRQYA